MGVTHTGTQKTSSRGFSLDILSGRASTGLGHSGRHLDYGNWAELGVVGVEIGEYKIFRA